MQDGQNLSEIYNSLASPSPDIDARYANQSHRSLVNDILFSDGILDGMRSELYRYQRRSVAAMLQKELLHSHIPDPLYIPMQGLDGKVFHFQPATMEIFSEPPKVWQSCGGILCEEMGWFLASIMLNPATDYLNCRYRENGHGSRSSSFNH